MAVDITVNQTCALEMGDTGMGAIQNAWLSNLVSVALYRTRSANPAPWVTLSCTTPEGAQTAQPTPIDVPSAQVLVDTSSAQTLTATASLQGTVRATAVMSVNPNNSESYEDPTLPQERDDEGNACGLGTPNGRPNHLRQCHLRYTLAWQGNATWGVDASGSWYGYRDITDADNDNDLHEGTYSLTLSPSGSTDVTGVQVRPRDLAVTLCYDGGLEGADLGLTPVENGAMSFTSTIDGVAMSGDFGQFNVDLAEDHATSGNGNSLTTYILKPGPDLYEVFPEWRGTLSGTAPFHDGTSDARVYALPQFPTVTDPGAIRRPTTTLSNRLTPFGIGEVVVPNVVGPYRFYVNELGQVNRPDGPGLEHATAGAPLNAARRRMQRDHYGGHDALWVRPEGETNSWAPFEIAHTSAFVVDDMVTAKSGATVSLGPVSVYNWMKGTGDLTMSVEGAYRKVEVGTGASDPRIYRSLWDDFEDMRQDATAYATSALITDADVKAYLSARKAWYNVRRKVQANADVCNWGNHRWLAVTAKADAARAFTLRINHRTFAISDNFHLGALDTPSDPHSIEEEPSTRLITGTPTDAFVDCGPFTLGTGDLTVAIDLAEAALRAGCHLDHVTGIQFRGLEAGGTYWFKEVRLASGTPTAANTVTQGDADWGYFTGVPYADDECVIPVVDGRVCCFADDVNSAGESRFALTWVNRQVSVNGNPYSPRGADETKTFDELRTLIGFQQGFHVHASATAPDGFEAYDWAIFLDTGWHAATVADPHPSCTATIKAADALVPACLYETWHASSRMRGTGRGLAFDIGARWPAAGVHVGLQEYANGVWTPVSTQETDAFGRWTNDHIPETSRGIWASALDGPPHPLTDPLVGSLRWTGTDLLDESQNPVSITGDVVNRSLTGIELEGDPADTAPDNVCLLRGSEGFFWRAYRRGTNVVVERRSRDDGVWVELLKLAGGPSPALSVKMGAVSLLYNDGAAIKRRNLDTEETVTVATGTNPREMWTSGHLLRVTTYWNASAIRAEVADAQGNVLHSGAVTVVGPSPAVPEQAFDVEQRLDGTLEGWYSDGSDTLHLLKSTDNGATWS